MNVVTKLSTRFLCYPWFLLQYLSFNSKKKLIKGYFGFKDKIVQNKYLKIKIKIIKKNTTSIHSRYIMRKHTIIPT
jgi:hypothetical protein